MNQNGYHQPTHTLDLSNPPQGGSGVPQKTNTETINNLITQMHSITEGLTDIELKIDACGTLINKASSMQTDIILLTDAVKNLTDLCLTLEKRIEVMEKRYKEEDMSITPKLKKKGLENLILLIIGASNRPISLLHLQKEAFLLWNFHPYIKYFLHFIQHYKGPFSSEVQKAVLYPFYLDGCWSYQEPQKNDHLSGGYVTLTPKGIEKYHNLFQNAQKNEKLSLLLTGIQVVRELYDKLSLEELLLLIYDTYPEYRIKSNEFNVIFKKRKILAQELYRKGFIDERRVNYP